jgi:hypothetical protein
MTKFNLMKQTFILIFSLIAITTSIKSQDKIFKKGGEVLKVKVLEIGIDDVQYKNHDNLDGPSYRIEKDRLVKIVYANGKVETYTASLKDKELYIGQKTTALKINFLSPLFGHTQLTYEKGITPGRSWEALVSLIGVGKSQIVSGYTNNLGTYEEIKRNQAGLGLGFGYKFIKTPDFINRNIRFAHLLQGVYLKPNIYTGMYGESILDSKTNIPTTKRRSVVYGAIMLEGGKQWVFSEALVFDFYAGVGYCADNIKKVDNQYYYSGDDAGRHFTNLRVGTSPGFSLSSGIRVGFLLNNKSK